MLKQVERTKYVLVGYVATDGLVLKHQAISIHNTDSILQVYSLIKMAALNMNTLKVPQSYPRPLKVWFWKQITQSF